MCPNYLVSWIASFFTDYEPTQPHWEDLSYSNSHERPDCADEICRIF